MKAAHEWVLVSENRDPDGVHLLGWRCIHCKKTEILRSAAGAPRRPPITRVRCQKRQPLSKTRMSRESGYSPGDNLGGPWIFLKDGPINQARLHTAYMVCKGCGTIRLSSICVSIIKQKSKCAVCDWRTRLESQLVGSGSPHVLEEIRDLAARLGYAPPVLGPRM